MEKNNLLKNSPMEYNYGDDGKSTKNHVLSKVCHNSFYWAGKCFRQTPTEVENPTGCQDDIKLYTLYNKHSCATCSERDSEKSYESQENSREIPKRPHTYSLCTNWQYCRITKTKMLRLAVQCVIFILLACCFGYLFGRSHHPSRTDSTDIVLSEAKNVIMKQYLTPVSLEDFRKQVRGARSYFDIFRVFFKNKKASDKTIYDILEGQSILNSNHRRDFDYDPNEEEDYSYVLDYRDEGYDHDSASQAYLHFDEVFQSEVGQCRDPRPEIVHVPSSGREMYFPDYTMVHRCKDVSGCCWNEKQECGVKSFNIITRPFLVFHIHPDGYVIPEGQTFTTKVFKNHTECECKHLKPLPSCERQCPFPFKKQRPGADCICECDEDTPACIEIKEGRQSLSEEDFECVKQGRCMKPQCQEGEFVMEKGYCPGVTHSQLSYYLTHGKNRIKESPENQRDEAHRNENTEQSRKHRHHHGENGHRRGKKHKNKHRVKK